MKQLRKLSPAAISEPVTPHTLRHSKAMHLLEANTPLPVIQDILGHANISSTEIYAHASTEMKRTALEKVQDCSPGAVGSVVPWRKDKGLLDWLRTL